MPRLLVGVDGSAGSLAALGWSADLARRGDFEVTAVRTFASTQAELDPAFDVAQHDDERDTLDAWAADALNGVRAKTVLIDGHPADALLAAAVEDGAGLLVVGARGGGGFDNLHIGSVAHHLIQHTTVPLAIVPADASPLTALVTGLDGSPGSSAAATFSADLAAALEIPIVAVYALEPFAEWVPETDPRSWRQRAQEDLRQWVAPLVARGLSVDARVERDLHPVAAVNRLLETRPGAAACVGTRGVGGFTGLRLGRVPLQLVHHTAAPVIIVPVSKR